MRYDSEKHYRKSIRLKGHDYSSPGVYFITICSQKKKCLFGEVTEEKMLLNVAGEMVHDKWKVLVNTFENIRFDKFVLMPNHLHGLIIIGQKGDVAILPDFSSTRHNDKKVSSSFLESIQYDIPRGTKERSIGRIIQAFKSITTHQYIKMQSEFKLEPFDKRLWQRNYFDKIIRSHKELKGKRIYIKNNPANWEDDEYHPKKNKKN